MSREDIDKTLRYLNDRGDVKLDFNSPKYETLLDTLVAHGVIDIFHLITILRVVERNC